MRTKQVSMLAAVAILIAVFSFSACTKDDDPEDPLAEEVYFTAKLNGKMIDFSEGISAQISSDKKHIVVGGEISADPISDGYDFALDDYEHVITAKTYTLEDAEMIARYYVQNYVNGEWKDTTVFNAHDPATQPGVFFSLTITSIDDWGIKGTFEGRILLSAGDQYIDVTEGLFSAPFVP